MSGDALAGGTSVADGLMAAVWLGVNGVLALGSHRAAGWMFPGNPRLDNSRSVRWLAAVLICISTIAVAAVVLGALGMLYRWPLMAMVGVAGWVMAWQCRDARAKAGARPAGKLATVGWTILAGFAIAHVIWRGLTGFPDDFDTLMYHLPIVVEWLQSASLYVPESSYWWTPGVGEIAVLWMVAPFSGDFLYSLGNVPFVVLWALGSYRLSRELRLPPKWAHLAAMSAMLVFTTLDELDDCQNDIAIAALFVCAAAFGGQYLRRPTLGGIVMMGLSVGALAGVKYNALGYAALVVVSVSGACLLERRYYDCMKCVFASAGGLILLGSYWYVRNAVVSGSPLYPMGLAEDIGTGYPDVSSTTLWGHGNPNVPRLAIAALWRMTGPLHYGAFWGLPIAIALLCWREIMLACQGTMRASEGSFSRCLAMNRCSITLRYATALLIGSFVLLLISPFCVEDVPRSMNHLIWAYTPARYGLSFLTMLVVVGAMATQRCYRIVCGRMCTERLRWEIVPLAVIVVLGLAQGWLVIAEHNRERRGGWTFDFCILLLDTILFLALAGLVAQSARGKVKSLFEKGSDPLEASRFHWLYGLAGEGQTPFRIGSMFGLIAASGVILMVATGYRSAQWHSGFGEHFDRLFRSDLFSPSDSSSPVWGDRIMVLDMRSYPFYGSSRGVTVYRPRSIGSVDEIVDAMRAGNFRMIATHRERERNYYLYTDTYNWLNDDKNRFRAIPTVGYYSLFSLEPVETDAGAP